MEHIDETANISKTECGHTFHFQCLYRWHRKNTNCPLCRRDFGKIEEEIEEPVYENPFALPRSFLELRALLTEHYESVPLEEFTGEIEERDIGLVATQANVSHEVAERYLRYYHGDIVDTLVYLTEHKDLPIPPFRRRNRHPLVEPYVSPIIVERVRGLDDGYESC